MHRPSPDLTATLVAISKPLLACLTAEPAPSLLHTPHRHTFDGRHGRKRLLQAPIIILIVTLPWWPEQAVIEQRQLVRREIPRCCG